MLIEFLLGLFPFLRYTHWDSARNGRNDGRRGIPTLEQEKNPPYVMQLKNLGEENIARLAQRWKLLDERLLADYGKAKQEAATLERYLREAKRDLERSSDDEKNAHRQYLEQFHLPEKWYWLLVAVIAVLEVPLNSVVFQLFGESKTFTLLTALGLALVLPLCAHFLGGFLKQGVLRDGKFSTQTAMTILMVLIPLGALGGIAYLREKFFEGAGVQQMLGIHLDFTSVTLTFFIINLLIFLVATVASYVAHDPIALQHYENRKHARKLKRNAEKRVKLYETRLAQNLERQQVIKATRLKKFGHVQNEAKESRDIMQKLMSVYHAHNLRARAEKGEMPRCFGSFPPIDVPGVIEPGNDFLDKAELGWEIEIFELTAEIAETEGAVVKEYSEDGDRVWADEKAKQISKNV